jgi:N-acetylmuramoyl-L-alanine amidase
VKSGDTVTPISLEPMMRGGVVLMPFSFVSDVLPRMVTGLVYDAARAELRLFSPVAARPPSAAPTRDAAVAPTPPPVRRERRRVIVDAGHGGRDPGMRGPIGARRKIFEKDVTLQVAHALRTILRDRGIDVVMTRSTDTLIALADRGRIANQSKGDLFLSIHVNAANLRWRQPAAARGFETYFLSEAKTEDERRVEEMENEVVKFEVGAETSAGDPLSFIIHDMEQNQHLRESSSLAEIVQQHLARTHPGPNRGVKQAGFRVLLTALMPAVLIEIGFGTNAAEAAYISSPVRQREIATAIADATVDYLNEYERRTGVGGH